MPYSKRARYRHHRQKSPGKFQKGTFKTVPLSHTEYKGKKFRKPGAKAVVGVVKKEHRRPIKRGGRPRKWGIQSILTLK